MDKAQSHDKKSEHAYLCFAWGESDLPVAVIAASRAEVLKFFVDEWFGEQPEKMHPDNRGEWDAAVAVFDAHNWREEGPLKWTFEIGGVEITQVGSTPSHVATSEGDDYLLVVRVLDQISTTDQRFGDLLVSAKLAAGRLMKAARPSVAVSATATPTVSAPPGVTVTVSYDAPIWLDAKIVQVDRLGLGFVEVTATAGRFFPFTFDKIEHYRGESLKDFGIRIGAAVQILVKNEKVERLRITSVTTDGTTNNG